MCDSTLALFEDLLTDLSKTLSSDVILRLREGQRVEPWPGISVSEFRAISLARSFYKKLQDDPLPEADSSALKKFLDVNKRVGEWTLLLRDSWDETLYGELRQVLYEFYYQLYPGSEGSFPLIPDDSAIWDNARVGPGAAIGSYYGDFYSKMFAGELTHCNGFVSASYGQYVRKFAEWQSAEGTRVLQYGKPRHIEGNRLRFVPKNRDISRTICVEPSLSMYGQLGIGFLITERLKSFFGIDLSRQPDINRELARIGSKYGCYSTIDLASASDSFSIKMLEGLLPGHFLSWLLLFRSPSTELPSGNRVTLNMLSTMGNGYTFPLQTMFFASIVVAAARARAMRLGRPLADAVPFNWGVFGDDIIVPTCFHYLRNGLAVDYNEVVVRDVIRLLTLLGFELNATKSYINPYDPFRESCGGDYFEGHQVRGVYIKTLRSQEARYVAINRLNEWSALTGIPLRLVVRRLLRSVRYLPVPRWEMDDSGIRVPFSTVKKLRVHKHLQSVIYRRRVPLTSFIRIGENRFLGRASKLYWNVSGLFLAFLSGSIRSGKISIRSIGSVPYRNDLGIAPEWDDTEAVHRPLGEGADGWRQWDTAVRVNLLG